MNNKKIRLAFIKFGGLATGGTERGLQTLDLYEEVWANNKPLESSVDSNEWLKEWIG